MFNILLVISRPSTVYTKKLYRKIQLPFVPAIDMDIQYQNGRGLSSIHYIYAMLNGTIEIGLQSLTEDEVRDLLATGDWSEEI